MHPASRLKILRLCAAFALVFGLLTIVSGAQGIFGGHQQKAALGNYVGFVLWFNFLAGFAYVVAAIGLWRGTLWAGRFSLGIAAATALVFMAFGIHVTFGGAYELRTVAAMTLRLFVWLGIGWLARPQRGQLA